MSVADAKNGKPWVLVVDDDRDVRETMTELLEDSGRRVACVENGKAALEFLQQHVGQVAVVLLDLMMPMMNGWEFRRAQLADPSVSKVPVVVITASNEDLAELGDVVILKKPIRFDDIVEKVQQYAPAW
jgi:CheY-like chemotaxis protein